MPNAPNRSSACQMISMYMPIFREKLEKLERRGAGHSDEAIRLRVVLARVDVAETPTAQLNEDGQVTTAAA